MNSSIKHTLTLLATWLLAPLANLSASEPSKPNIVYILADDLGYTIEGADKKGGGNGEGTPVGAITRDGPVTRGFDEFFGFHHARMMKSVFENDRVTQIIEPVDMLPALVKRSTGHITARGPVA